LKWFGDAINVGETHLAFCDLCPPNKRASEIAKHASDVITQTNSDKVRQAKQNGGKFDAFSSA